MKKTKKRLLLVLTSLLVCNVMLLAQVKRIVTGDVKDNKGLPISSATITIKGTTQSVTTDQNGHYSINVEKNNAILVFSSVGFTTKEVNTQTSSKLDAVLFESVSDMNEVVVTALGVTKQKRQLGYSVTNVKGSELAKTNEINPINALQGRVAGVQIDQGSGGLFGNTKIVIRGNSTLGTNNQPVFVIDGVIMDNDIFSGTGRDFGNDLKNLNMDDFETVSVLKGSAAAALYGTRAINGVILITTKKGVQRKGLGLSVNQTFNVQQGYRGPDFQNVFGSGDTDAFNSDGWDNNYPNPYSTYRRFPVNPITNLPYIDRGINREGMSFGPKMEGQAVTNFDGTPTKFSPQKNNFLDAFQTGTGSNTSVSLDGATDRSTFRLSYNHNDAEGIYQNNKLIKNSFDLRVTHKINSKLSVDVSTAYTSLYGKNPPSQNGGINPGYMYIWILPRDYNTKYWMQKDKYTSILGGRTNPSNPDEPNKVMGSEYWFQVYNNNYTQNEQLLRSRVALTAELTDWAKLIVEGNINNIYRKSESKELGQGLNFTGGSYGLGFNTKESQFMKFMLMMNKDINKDFTISGYVGGEMQNYKSTFSQSNTSGGLNYPGGFFISNSVNPPSTNGGILSSKKFNSLFSSADLGYKNQLFLQATFRADWSSALTYTNGLGNNAYSYPALSASWIFSETFKMPSFISYGKLRTNIAALGGDTDPFLLNPGFTLNGFSQANGNTVPLSTYSSNQILQPGIRPVRKISKEIGMEMRFLNSRIGFDISLYQDNTKNQILDIPAPIESGVSSMKINAGNIQNKGIEIALDATPISTKNFSWNTAVNFSSNKNLIVELYPGRTEYALTSDMLWNVGSWAIVGKSYGTLRSTTSSEKYKSSNPADPKNGLPILNWRGDRRVAFPKQSGQLADVGDINAKFRAGFDNTFRYKNFTLNVLFDAKIGGDMALLSYRYGTHTGALPNTLAGRSPEYGGITWTSKFDGKTYDDGMIPDGVFASGITLSQPGGAPSVNVGGMTFKEAYDKGYVEPNHAPMYYYRYGSFSTGVSDYWVFENSWISLRQVALSYSFEKKMYSKLKLNGLNVSLAGRDLLYLYNTLPYNYNPASNNSNNTSFSGENGFLPMTRSIVFSLRANF